MPKTASKHSLVRKTARHDELKRTTAVQSSSSGSNAVPPVSPKHILDLPPEMLQSILVHVPLCTRIVCKTFAENIYECKKISKETIECRAKRMQSLQEYLHAWIRVLQKIGPYKEYSPNGRTVACEFIPYHPPDEYDKFGIALGAEISSVQTLADLRAFNFNHQVNLIAYSVEDDIQIELEIHTRTARGTTLLYNNSSPAFYENDLEFDSCSSSSGSGDSDESDSSTAVNRSIRAGDTQDTILWRIWKARNVVSPPHWLYLHMLHRLPYNEPLTLFELINYIRDWTPSDDVYCDDSYDDTLDYYSQLTTSHYQSINN
jgi:hypothetical protein